MDMYASESLTEGEETEEEFGWREEDEPLRDENVRRHRNESNVEQRAISTLEELGRELGRELDRIVREFRQNREAQQGAYMLLAFLPFALLFLFKLCFVKSAAIFSILAGYMIFISADSNVTSIASNQSGSIFSVLFFIAAYYLSIVYIIGLSLQPILGGLIMQFQMYQDCLTTLYYVIMTDLAAKHITVSLKGLLVSLPASIMVVKRRRRLYQFLEYCSQTYRAAIAAPWWITYFFGPSLLIEVRRGSFSPLADVVFVGTYLLLKLIEILVCSRRMYRSFISLLNLVSVGVRPTKEEIAKDPECSICLDNIQCPVKLSCTHMFCEECTEMWLMVKQTCPVCRAHVEEQDSSFFDASTCKAIRIY